MRLPALIAVLAASLAGCGGQSGAERYSVKLEPVNDSGVRGTAELTRAGEHLVVHIRATGMEPRRIHAQHLYAFKGGDSDSRCPTKAAADDDDNGLIDSKEGRAAYGPSLLALEPYPTLGADGKLDYELALELDSKQADSLGESLQSGVLMLQGAPSPGSGYRFELPAACGRLMP